MARWEPRLYSHIAIHAYNTLKHVVNGTGCGYLLEEAVERLLVKRTISYTCMLLGCIIDYHCSVRDSRIHCGPGVRAAIRALYMLYGVMHPERVACLDGYSVVLDSVGLMNYTSMVEDCVETYVTIHEKHGVNIFEVERVLYKMIEGVHKEMGSSCAWA